MRDGANEWEAVLHATYARVGDGEGLEARRTREARLAGQSAWLEALAMLHQDVNRQRVRGEAIAGRLHVAAPHALSRANASRLEWRRICDRLVTVHACAVSLCEGLLPNIRFDGVIMQSPGRA